MPSMQALLERQQKAAHQRKIRLRDLKKKQELEKQKALADAKPKLNGKDPVPWDQKHAKHFRARVNLSIKTLTEALGKIDYALATALKAQPDYEKGYRKYVEHMAFAAATLEQLDKLSEDDKDAMKFELATKAYEKAIQSQDALATPLKNLEKIVRMDGTMLLQILGKDFVSVARFLTSASQAKKFAELK
jgi:hypothetical protein